LTVDMNDEASLKSAMADERAGDKLREAYARWRSSALGRISDRLEQRLVLELAGPPAGRTILDVGCGDGALASEFVRHGAIVTGLDADPAMIAAARRQIEVDDTRLQLVEGRAESLPFPDNVFDRVLAVTVLCFVQDTGGAVAEMARVVKPGGRIVIGELGRWSTWAAYRRIRGWLGNPTWRAATFRSAAQLRGLMRGAGLNTSEVRGAVFYPPTATAARLLASIDGWLGRTTTFGAAFIAVAATKPMKKGP
jgi:ubiquinone/menaquinone biosynthesis C-methylase UbiE